MMFRLLIGAVLLLPCAAQAAPACPATFSKFVAEFERSAVFRQAHTRFPLPYSYVDAHAEPEPKTVALKIARADIGKYPGSSFPSPTAQRAVPLKRKVSLVNEGVTVVRFDKPDTDYMVEFHFKALKDCWQLVRVYNGSL